MKLSTEERLEEVRSWKPYEIDFEVDPEAACYSGDYRGSDLKQSNLLSAQETDLTVKSCKNDNEALESEEFFFSDKIELIKQAITETIFEMKTRQGLNSVFIQLIDSKIDNFLHELRELKHWTLGNNPSIEARRIHLEKELLQLEKEKRINNLSCWKDLLWLKKDLREAVSEYKSLMRMKNVLS